MSEKTKFWILLALLLASIALLIIVNSSYSHVLLMQK
jgi:hypothetical protein